MTDKMIEEMAKDLKECLPNNWYWQKSVDSDTYFVAKQDLKIMTLKHKLNKHARKRL